MRASIDTGATDLEPLVAAATARCLRLPPGIVGPDVPFARLGLDSLGCLELAAELETALGMRVPADAVVECTTVRSLCAALSAQAQGTSARIRSNAILPADVVPRRDLASAALSPSLATARHVLLTGATGFLGSALLRALIDRTPARVTCLVRSGPGVRSAIGPLEGDGPIADLPPAAGRVEIVDGDLTLPSAGLSHDDWGRLVEHVDAVCHAGASINWIAGYDALRNVNVLATREMLRLAAEAGASFHFISSVSVCYSTVGPRTVDERHDPLEAIEGLHFGYAQSKAVAESLVRQAGARGLRTRIYRPALISGDSRTGRFNRDDMLSRLIAGCVRMGAAPDLDWRLDALPVDSAAALILALSGGSPAGAWHLTHPHPRHWRECVLWMRLYGYAVTLLPYREWTARLRQTATGPDHPLRPLRSFFLDAHSGGLTIPELHEQSRAPKLDAERTSAAIARTDVEIAPLDAELMDRYFAAFVEDSILPPPGPPAQRRTRRQGGAQAGALAREMLSERGESTARLDIQPFAAGHSIISELTAWQSGGACGLFGVRGASGGARVLKIMPYADDVRTVGEALASICGERLGEAYREFGGGLGMERGHEREIALYRDADPVIRSHTPRVVATHADPRARTWAVLLEDLRGAALLDSVDRPDAWTSDHIRAAVDGIAAVHGAWHARADELRRQARPSWMGAVRTTASMQAMAPLWRALADHAAPMFAAWTDASVPARQYALIDRIAEWRPALDAAPQTLVHNDFNPRNVCLRPIDGGWRLCAFDWELAAVGTPMRDLAEFLCFVSPLDVQPAWIGDLIDRHATRFAAGAGVQVDPIAWHAAFGAALAELLVDRLSVYAMVHRVRPQRFLPRVLRTWSVLHSLFPAHGVAS